MASKWPKQDRNSMNAFYGNPDRNQDGAADSAWESKNLTTIVPPYNLWYPDDRTGKLVKRSIQFRKLRVHNRCSVSLLNILTKIGEKFSAADIEKYELDICGGAFNFRLMRSGRSLSIHSWGAAIDLSHLINRYKRKYDGSKNMMPEEVVKIFSDEGWTWGGIWKTGDAMHFQAADL
jgi:hypothetical protein